MSTLFGHTPNLRTRFVTPSVTPERARRKTKGKQDRKVQVSRRNLRQVALGPSPIPDQPPFSSRIRRNRSALTMTETEESDMAAPAIIGLRRVPVNG